ncbi:shikimate dehydrogenase [Deferribacter autotrophicus]|uniref:Shikimate dehydrogenase (NADP(+)) n=1 Tax=Deferribacter autotrophicus TaxID=500465 RepID=A0A5A8F5A9_9BACT|nr:shikimate dehydrogenase [Deferribacter autotrophicus]KAA0259306.1 shikimate dehydrogenase [Deferribacter autotrophicus]
MSPKNYCLIGHPVNHSLSPIIHNYFIFHAKLNAGYVCFDIVENEFEKYIDLLRNNFDGFNITVPYKEKIIKYLDEIDIEAGNIGAVNCVKNINGKLVGFNTDIYGIKITFEKYNVNLNYKDILVIGSGGATKPLIQYIKNFSYSKLDIVNRTVSKAENLIEKFKLKKTRAFPLEYLGKNEIYDIIINTTSIGLEGGWFCKMNIEAKEFVFDMQYKLESKTPFLSQINVEQFCDGKIMLIYQAYKSFEIWNSISLQFDLTKIIKQMRG